jgi:hypothetical protein
VNCSVALDSSFPYGAVHALHLTVGPGMVDLCRAVFDAMLMTAQIEHVGDEPGGRAVAVGGITELNAIMVRMVCIL